MSIVSKIKQSAAGEKPENGKKQFVWNEEKVSLDENSPNGTYEFENFSGFIQFRGNGCRVENASFTVIIRHIEYLTGEHQPVKPRDAEANQIVWKDGTVVSGSLFPIVWEGGNFKGKLLRTGFFRGGVFSGEKLICCSFSGGTVDHGTVECINWERGDFSGDSFTGTFHCGVFSGGVFEGTWLDGHFKGGVFKGDWKGGTWSGGSFEGSSCVGDGTFGSVRKDNEKSGQ